MAALCPPGGGGVIPKKLGRGVPLGYKNSYPVQDHKTLILRPCSRVNVKKRYPVPDYF